MLAEHIDTGVIFARALSLATARYISVKEVVKYELAFIPVPILIEENGLLRLRVAKAKSTLKNNLKVEVS